MRIVVWGINYAPEVTGIAPYNAGLCRYFAAQGHDVRMVTTFAYYPQWQKSAEDSGRLYRTDHDEAGVPVHRCWHYVPPRPSTLRRIAHEFSFGVTSWLRILSLPRADVYVVVSPPLILGPLAWLATRLKRSRYLFHVQDLQPDAALGLGMVRPGLFTKLLFAVEAFAYRHAAAVSGISQGMLDAFTRKGVPEAKRWYFPNWVPDRDAASEPKDSRVGPDLRAGRPAPDAIRGPLGDRSLPVANPSDTRGPLGDRSLPVANPTDTRGPLGARSLPGSPFRATHGIAPEAFLAIYSGNVGNKQGLGVLLDAALLLARENPAASPPIEIVIAGDGAARAGLAARHAALDLRRVRMLPLLSDLDYRAMLQTAQVALITQEKGTGQFFFPSKLLTVLGAGLIVLAVADEDSELARALRQADCGFVVPPGEPAALAQSLGRIAATPPAELAALRNRGADFVATFSARFVLPEFESRLKKLTQAES